MAPARTWSMRRDIRLFILGHLTLIAIALVGSL
jgi:hypothetical protein